MPDLVFISNNNFLTTNAEIENNIKNINNEKLLNLIKKKLKIQLQIDGKYLDVCDLINYVSADNHFVELNENNFDSYISWTNFYNLIGPMVAKVIKNEKFSTAFIDNYFSEYNELISLLEKKPKVVALSCTHSNDLKLSEITKNIRRISPKSKIILGGKNFTELFLRIASAPPTLKNLNHIFSDNLYDFDIISGGINNQGISNLNSLLRNFITKSNFIPRNINNIIYKSNGFIKVTKLTCSNNLIKFYTNPDWRSYIERCKRKYKVACVRWSIGCPYTCKFCWTRILEKFSVKRLDDLLSEIQLLYSLGIKYIYFIDETFTINKFLKLLCKELIKRKIEIEWSCCTRLDKFDLETVSLMSEAGCRLALFGIESGNDNILRNMNKVNTVDNYYKNLEYFKRNKIITFGTFIIGFPGENKKTINDTINFLNHSGLDLFRLHLWFYYSHLPLLKKIKEIFNLKGHGYLWEHKTMTSEEATEYFEYIVSNVKNSYVAHNSPSIINGILCSKGWSAQDVLSIYRIRDSLIKLSIQNDFSRFNIYLQEIKNILCKNYKQN